MRARLSGSTLMRPITPFIGVVALALAATLLRTAGTDWKLVAAAAVVALSAGALALAIERSRWRSISLLLLPIAVDAMLGLLRQAQGGSTSGYQPLAILPVVWVGLTLRRRAVATICACTTLLFAVPILVVGSPLYPPAAWRSVVLWTIVSPLIGYGANRVLARQRDSARAARMHASGLDRVIETQTAIGTAELSVEDVMTATVEGALTVTEADGACIELLDGDDIVCTAVAGTALPFLGMRLPADTSITGECFRTRQVLICTDSEQDSRVAREACKQVGARSLIVIPLLHGGVAKGVLVVWSADAHEFVAAEAQLLALLANTIGAALVRSELVAQLTAHAVTDDLTGLASRRAWYQHLDLALARAQRSGQPLSVLALDLDRFKQINDTQGHSAGDRLLKTAASCWSGQLRSTDLLGRIGGDEFGIVLENTDAAHAVEVMARLGQSFSGRHSASIGFAVWDAAEDVTALLARADADMYVQKQARSGARTTAA
jgi:diguanylate cyclase (GGDEF)-like protein